MAPTHNRAIVAALYNPLFHQVVSVDTSGKVSVWDVDKGSLVVNFDVERTITAAAFDKLQYQVIFGCDDV